MRACEHCGLSMSDSATFCQVCGTRAVGASPQPDSTTSQICVTCGHPGPLSAVGRHLLCARCRGTLELLIDREHGTGMSVTLSENDSDARRSEVRTVAAVYSAGGDSDTCEACKSMEGRSTTNLAEAAAWCPNPACTSRDGCFCMVIYEMTRLDSHDLDRFLEYAVQNGVPVSAQAVSEFYGARQAAEREESRRWSDANAPMHNAHRCEKSDPNKAASLYRQTILNLLDYSGDPLASSEVRRSLLFAFDRLTVILRRYGMKADALEEADSAASLGLLDDVEDGTKGVRERLARRRNSLRKALSAE